MLKYNIENQFVSGLLEPIIVENDCNHVGLCLG